MLLFGSGTLVPLSAKFKMSFISNLSSTEYHSHNKMRFFIGDDKFLPDFLVNSKKFDKALGNLILPKGKPKNGQYFLNKILELI